MRDWREITVAEGATHHELSGAPLYPERYMEVLKFHAPGLAPVRTSEAAWHIDAEGRPAYTQRFLRTFGFYEGRAAVEAHDGWHHILPSGGALYPERYGWCGNFQGGRCAVREVGGLYLHLDDQGRPLYPERHRYAGDYRDGIAVVQREDGLCTHIDLQGGPLHGQGFIDLDVYHKGFARARDARGWMHVDHAGRPIYSRRFAAVEPFYNGQARVERFDGGLEVIREDGQRALELSPARRSELAAVSSDIVGFWRTRTLATLVQLDLPDALPGSALDVARAIGLPLERATRLLRAAWELELTEPTPDGTWAPTARGLLLRRGAGMDAAARMWAGQHYDAWRELGEALRDPAWSARVRGRFFRELTSEAEGFHRAMSRYAQEDYREVPAVVPWSRHAHILDAGGGEGALLRSVLEAAPSARGTLLELPLVLAQLPPPDVGGRFQVCAGDLLEPWPVRADAILLARVLHDWDDDAATTILTHARSALTPGGRLYLVEMILPEDSPSGGLLDLNMLVMTGGQERTWQGWRALLARAGWALVERRELSGAASLMIAEVMA